MRPARSRKRIFSMILALAVCLALCAVFLPVLLPYTQPMDSQVFDFGMGNGDSEATQSWDGNGWEAFTDEAGVRTSLSPSELGFSSLSWLGQTFYYSRVLDQALPDPLLSIDTVNRSIAVFLDNELIYTDCPELDNWIGHLTLPMLEWDRLEPVRISLPQDYVGKTLTIAQSTPGPGQSDRQSDTLDVTPCTVQLYCGYAYESQIVAGATRAAYPAVVMSLTALAVLTLFAVQSLHGNSDWGLVFFALFLLLNMVCVISNTPFGNVYFPFKSEHGFFFLGDTASGLAAAMLTLFLTTHMGRPRRYFTLVLGIAQLISVLLFAGVQLWIDLLLSNRLLDIMTLARCLSLVSAAAVLVLGAVEWRRGSHFFADFMRAALVTAFVSAMVFLLFSGSTYEVFHRYTTYQFPLGRFLLFLSLLGSLWAISCSFVADKMRRSAERTALQLKEQMARDSYAAIQLQTRETAMLRHDLNRHLGVVGSLLADGQAEKAKDYIRQVTEQSESLRPILSSGNYMVDTILNSRLSAAAEAGIRVRIERGEVPNRLTLTDTDLSSLLLNALDNAIHAASAPGLYQAEIVIDLHVRDNLFYFSCENTVGPSSERSPEDKKRTVPKHGYGLAIMERIAEQYGGIMEAAAHPGRFCLTFVLPVSVTDPVQADA